MKGSKLLITILELTLLAIFVVGLLITMNSRVKPTLVYQYSRFLAEGSVVELGDLQEVKIPHEAVTSDFVLKAEDIIGKAVISDVYPQEYVVKPQLSTPENLDVFASMDLKDYVKVVIPVSNATLGAGLINSGDTVDLVFVGKGDTLFSNQEDVNATYATRFMTDVLVYKVMNGSANEVTNNVESGITKPDSEGNIIPNTGDAAYVVCAVKQDQMLEIMTRLTKGEIHVISRFDDTESKEGLKDFYMGTPGTVILGEGELEKNTKEK